MPNKTKEDKKAAKAAKKEARKEAALIPNENMEQDYCAKAAGESDYERGYNDGVKDIKHNSIIGDFSQLEGLQTNLTHKLEILEHLQLSVKEVETDILRLQVNISRIHRKHHKKLDFALQSPFSK